MDVLQSVFASVFLKVAERQVHVLAVPGAFSKRDLSFEARMGYLGAIHGQFIAPATWGRTGEQFAGWIAGIDDWFSWFPLEFTIGSIIDDFEVCRFSRTAATDFGPAFEPLRICSIVPVAISTTFPAGCDLVTERSEVVDMVSRDVGAGSGLKPLSKGQAHQQAN